MTPISTKTYLAYTKQLKICFQNCFIKYYPRQEMSAPTTKQREKEGGMREHHDTMLLLQQHSLPLRTQVPKKCNFCSRQNNKGKDITSGIWISLFQGDKQPTQVILILSSSKYQ